MSKFHLSNGLYFKKEKDGAVRIVQTKDGKEIAKDESNVYFAVFISANSWCSIIHSMSNNSELNYEDVEKMHGIL